MTNLRLISATIFVMIFNHENFAQPRPVNIGDKIPGLEFNKIVNYKKDKVLLSEFKDKIVILDFWATWCSPCVGMIPITDSLEGEFEGKIEFLPVTYQSAKIVRDFADKIKLNKNINFHSIAEDTVLSKIFEHAYMPFYVFLNSSGKVLGWGHMRSITKENIEQVLAGKIPNALLEKREIKKKSLDTEAPLFALNDISDYKENVQSDSVINKNVFFYSAFTRHIEKYPSVKAFSTKRFTAVNSTITSLIKAAYGGENWSITFGNNRFFWEVGDSTLAHLSDDAGISASKLSRDSFNSWKLENTFCYELYGSFVSKKEKYELVQAEVNKYIKSIFGIEAKLEKRKMPALILRRTSNQNRFAYHGVVMTASDKFRYTLDAHFENWHRSNSYQNMPPLIDETGYKGYVNIELKSNLSDLDSVNKELAKYDLKFVKMETDVDVIVVRKASNDKSFL